MSAAGIASRANLDQQRNHLAKASLYACHPRLSNEREFSTPCRPTAATARAR